MSVHNSVRGSAWSAAATFVLLLMSGCADELTRPVPSVSDANAAYTAASGPVVEQVRGSGHFSEGSMRRTFTFTARKALDGSTTGSYTVTGKGAAGVSTAQGEITCLRVIGDEAWIGGTHPNGRAIAFRVVDAGEGAGQVDQLSVLYYSPFLGVSFPEFACRSAVALPLRPINSGNVQVSGERVEFTTVYENDFESGAGPEWSTQTRSTTPSGQTFLGEFSSIDEHGPILNLTGLPSHRYIRVSLDLYAIRTLDGSDALYGLDLFTFSEARSGFSYPTTFSGTGADQAFPGRYPEDTHRGFVGASGVQTLGYVWHGQDGSFPMDATYPVEFTIAHSADDMTFAALASGLQDFTDADGNFTDESWGIDNVRVQVLR